MRLLKLFILILVLVPGIVNAQSVIELIERDRQTGTISRTEQAIMIGYSAVAPERLPARYQNPEFEDHKCGFARYEIIREEYPNLSPELQALFRPLLLRQSMANEYVSPSGQFRIHYETGGVNQVPPEDLDSDGIPDYVEEAALSFEHAHRILVDTLGFQAPPSDGGEDGPEYDVYIVDMNDYGATHPYELVPGSTTSRRSYIEIENDYAESWFSTHGLEGLRVTAVHEYFHAVHVGYIMRSTDIFFYEWCSTWFEERAYPDINDYLQYLHVVFSNPSRPINYANGSFKYGMCIWNHFLTKRHGEDILSTIWENMQQERALDALSMAIESETGSTFPIELQAFFRWNYFTGTRADTDNYYTEGNLYPEVTFSDTIFAESDTTIYADVGYLSADYISIARQQPTNFTVNYLFDPGDEGNIHGSAILDENGAYTSPTPFGFEGESTGEFSIASYTTNSKLVLIPSVSATQSRPGTSTYPVTFSLNFQGADDIQENILQPTIPSPANFSQVQEVKIPFVLTESAEVEVKIFTTTGRLVKSFMKAPYMKGLHEVKWNGNDNNNRPVPSGVYIYVIDSPLLKDMKKMAVIR
ncbi:MAG: hypothetical protein GY863_15995 [bacterium]|nr:hypothetical protein [bacterium]